MQDAESLSSTHHCQIAQIRPRLSIQARFIRPLAIALLLKNALLRRRDFRHGPLVLRLPRLGLLERAHHDEDDVSLLRGLHNAGDIGAALPDTLDGVKNGGSGGGAGEEVALDGENM